MKETKDCKLQDYIENANFQETGFCYTLSLISGKYKMIILYCLMEYQAVRFNELQRYLGKISDKTLSRNLKELEQDELIHREVYPQIPPKVEYSLTERGKSLMTVLDQAVYLGSGKIEEIPKTSKNNQNILKSHNKIKRITNIEKSLTREENSDIITHVLETGTQKSKKETIRKEKPLE